jgi:holin-like protein
MASLAILLLFQLMGFLVSAYAHVPLPGNVVGLLLLLGALFSGVVKLEQVEPAANFLLRHMLVLFAPVIAGTLALGPVLRADWAAFAAICVLATPATLVVTAWVAKVVGGWERARRREEGRGK